MSSAFGNRRKPRKVGGGDDDEDNGELQEPVVKRPGAKSKPKNKSKLSFGSGATSMADDEDEPTEVVIPKRHGLGRKAMERNAVQRNMMPSGASETLSARVAQDQDRPSYSNEYLKELRDSTPSTPKTDNETDRTVDVAAKFGEVMTVSAQSIIPSEAEIREKKARRARLALEHGASATGEEDYIALDDNAMNEDGWNDTTGGDKIHDSRLVRDDEDFAEGFEEYVEDGKFSLGRKAEREQKRKDRENMRDLIDDAEGGSDEDSDMEEKAAYEATQTKAAMGKSRSDGIDRPRTPPRMTPLPRLPSCIERLRTSLASMETHKTQMIGRMEELRKEKEDIAIREVEIQALIKEAGDNYERLKQEAGVDLDKGAANDSRGLENIGTGLEIVEAASAEPPSF